MEAKAPTKRSDAEIVETLRAVPQRVVGRMLGGRQTVHLQRLSARWSCPVDGNTVDLFDVMAWLWKFLKRHGPVLAELIDGDGDSNSPAMQHLKAKTRKIQAEAEAAEMRAAQKAGTLSETKVIHAMLVKLLDRYQSAAQQAQRQWGRDGFEMFNELQNGLREDMAELMTSGEASEKSKPASKAKRPARSQRKASK